jgi:hypothetical protein
VLGCAGLGLEPRPSSLGGVQVARETFVAPQAVVRVRWTRPLVHKQAFFAYNPQEFATAAVSPDGQTVFVGSSEKQLYALRYRDGEVLWQRPFKGGLASEPLYVPAGEAHPEPLLLVGDDDGSLTALAPATGEVRWTTQLSGPIRTLPTVSGGLVYTTTTSGRIYAHKLDTGKWDIARAAGADDCLDPTAEGAAKALLKATGGVAVAVDFVGAGPTFGFGFGALRKSGKLVCVGLFGGVVPLAPAMVAMKSVSIMGSYVGSLDEMRELMDLARAGRLPPLPLLSEPLAEASRALDELRAGRIRGRAILRP